MSTQQSPEDIYKEQSSRNRPGATEVSDEETSADPAAAHETNAGDTGVDDVAAAAPTEEEVAADAAGASGAGAVEAEAADPAAEEAANPLHQLEADLERLRAERDEAQEKLLRQAAEFQNYKRRQQRERAQLIDVGQGQVILPMLEVLDDLERSLRAADEFEAEADTTGPAFSSLREGVQQVRQKFLDELKRLGVEPIEAKGQPFNEQLHEAMMQQPAPDDAEPGTVLQEIRTGYRMGERILRHSQVIVAA
jgi:molecular chaperone GrpE